MEIVNKRLKESNYARKFKNVPAKVPQQSFFFFSFLIYNFFVYNQYANEKKKKLNIVELLDKV